jgi:hypothetical protein
MRKTNRQAANKPDSTATLARTRAEFVSRFALGEDPRSIAEELSIPFDQALTWLRDGATLTEAGEVRQWLVNAYHAHGAHLVTTAMVALDAAVATDPELAAKVVIASGVLKATAENPRDVLAERVRMGELASRLRFLDKLRDLGISEEEWHQMMATPREARRTKRTH